jgi:hypothetical protein
MAPVARLAEALAVAMSVTPQHPSELASTDTLAAVSVSVVLVGPVPVAVQPEPHWYGT